MRFHTLARDPPPARLTPQRHTIPADRGETIQHLRLAATVLKKSPEDLSALAETNPELMWEWIAEFARQKAKAESDARLWAAATALLATSSAGALPSAAE
jgi:anthranilate phosphoribosyltransferase